MKTLTLRSSTVVAIPLATGMAADRATPLRRAADAVDLRVGVNIMDVDEEEYTREVRGMYLCLLPLGVT